jgi:UDP-3-O-[3-hydroxymyristoyl] glucosamine N-acyltransferase
MRISAKELAILLEAQIEGNPEAIVDKLVKIEEADASSLCFIANPKYAHYASSTHAGILVVSKDFDIENQNGTTYLRVQDPYSSFAILLEKFAQQQASQLIGIEQPSFIHETAHIAEDVYIGAFSYIGKNARIAKGVKIYPNCYVADNVDIAENTVLHPSVVVYHHTQIGANCILHAGVVVGSDGFGFAPQKDGSFSKVPQTGNVVIGKDVEIGANTVIDRATLGSTVIEDGVKLDNLVQIAHNVTIGKNSVVAAQAGISGSSKIGKQVMVGGQAGLVGHIQIADGVKINAQSGVSKSINASNSFVSGSPAEPFRQHYKNLAYVRNMAELLERIENLERELFKRSE